MDINFIMMSCDVVIVVIWYVLVYGNLFVEFLYFFYVLFMILDNIVSLLVVGLGIDFQQVDVVVIVVMCFFLLSIGVLIVQLQLFGVFV